MSVADELAQRFSLARTTSDPVGLERARDAAATRVLGDPPRAAALIAGRYVLQRRLGAGGHGVVYVARDQKLDREVAIKLLRPQAFSDATARARLDREAKVLARLCHPNIVTVFDQGCSGEHTFIAMELVRGTVLSSWLAAQKRSVGAILAVFGQAGQGLAAAHAQGLVHRDFKPSNVIVADDGTVKVLDFGLCRPVSFVATQPMASDAPTPEHGADHLTDNAAILGTPRYMAPEQHRGQTIDRRTDIYAFCAALFEALYHRLPWEPNDSAEHLGLARAKHAAWVRAAYRRELPRRLRRALERGLAPDPKDRPATMELLLRDLAPRQHRYRVAAAAAALSGATLIGGFAWHHDGAARRCAAVDDPMDALWSPTRGDDITRALDSTAVAVDIRQRLDTWVERWKAARVDACMATHSHRTQSSALLDARMACLDVALAGFGQLADAFTEVDPATLSRAGQAVDALPDPTMCSAAVVLRASRPAPTETSIAIEERIVTARVFMELAQVDQARTRLESALEQAQSHGDPWLQAQALLQLGLIDHDVGRYEAATDRVRAATVAAERSGDPRLRAHAWRALGHLRGVYGHGLAEAQHLLEVADALLADLPESTSDRQHVEESRALVLVAAAQPKRALAHADEAIALARRAGQDDALALARALVNRGLVLAKLERTAEAKPGWEEALSILERRLGPLNSRIAVVLSNLGVAARASADPQAAAAYYSRALELVGAEGSANPALEASILANLAAIDRDAGRLDAALDRLGRACEVRRALEGPNSLAVAQLELRLGDALMAAEDASALGVLERAYHTLAGLQQVPPQDRLIAEYYLARALAPTDIQRARGLAESALLRAATLDDGGEAQREIGQWLQLHTGRTSTHGR